MQRRKETAWRKNRKFGDVYGGRRYPKIADRIFNRLHNLAPPGPHDTVPILIEENPSRDYGFPLSGEETLEALRALPERDYDGITHLWLRRIGAAERRRRPPLAEYICGSGVHLVVMYPWRTDGCLDLGRHRPTGKRAQLYERFGARVQRTKGGWSVEFAEEELRRFWVHLLYHEIGHHVDWYQRQWSKANRKVTEEFADQYAVSFGPTGDTVLDGIRRD